MLAVGGMGKDPSFFAPGRNTPASMLSLYIGPQKELAWSKRVEGRGYFYGITFNPAGKIIAGVIGNPFLYFIRALDGIFMAARNFGARNSGD